MKRAIASLAAAALISTALTLLTAGGTRAAPTDSTPTVSRLADVSTLFHALP